MRLIDADAAKILVGIDEFGETLDMMPTVDAEPVVHARWIEGACSNCGSSYPTDTIHDYLDTSDSNYCWRCGAKMDEEAQSDGETR